MEVFKVGGQVFCITVKTDEKQFQGFDRDDPRGSFISFLIRSNSGELADLCRNCTGFYGNESGMLFVP